MNIRLYNAKILTMEKDRPVFDGEIWIKNEKIVLPKLYKEESHVWHLFVIRTKDRDKLQEYLKIKGIQTLIHYPIPPHKQNAYKEWNNLSFPITEKIHKEVLSLPISPAMNKEEAFYIAQILNEF